MDPTTRAAMRAAPWKGLAMHCALWALCAGAFLYEMEAAERLLVFVLWAFAVLNVVAAIALLVAPAGPRPRVAYPVRLALQASSVMLAGVMVAVGYVWLPAASLAGRALFLALEAPSARKEVE